MITREEYLEELFSSLPHILQKDGNAENLKGLLTAMADTLYYWEDQYDSLGNLMSLDDVTEHHLDMLGRNLLITRQPEETDSAYKLRILSELAVRNSPVSIPSIQAYLKNVFGENLGSYEIVERPFGDPASYYVKLGFNSEEDLSEVYKALELFKPAGVDLIKTLVFEYIWSDMNTIGDGTWGHFKTNDLRW